MSRSTRTRSALEQAAIASLAVSLTVAAGWWLAADLQSHPDPRGTPGSALRRKPEGYLRWGEDSGEEVEFDDRPTAPEERAEYSDQSGEVRLRVRDHVGEPVPYARLWVEQTPHHRVNVDFTIDGGMKSVSGGNGDLTLSAYGGPSRYWAAGPNGGRARGVLEIVGGIENGVREIRIGKTREVTLRPVGIADDQVVAALVTDGHPELSRLYVRSEPQTGAWRVSVSATGETLVALLTHDDSVVGIGRTVDSESMLEIACHAPVIAEPVRAGRSLYWALHGGRPRPWFWLDGMRRLPEGVRGRFLAVAEGFSPSATDAAASEPAVQLMPRRAAAKRRIDETRSSPCPGTLFLVSQRLELLQRELVVGICRVRSDEEGLCVVSVPADGKFELTAWHPHHGLFEMETTKSLIVAVSRAGAQKDKWYFAEAHSGARVVAPKTGAISLATDVFGILRVPTQPGESMYVAEWPGKARSDPPNFEYVALDDLRSVWLVRESPPKRGAARWLYAGSGVPPTSLAVTKVGVSFAAVSAA